MWVIKHLMASPIQNNVISIPVKRYQKIGTNITPIIPIPGRWGRLQ